MVTSFTHTATGQRSVRKGCAMEVQETKCTVTKSEGTSITMMQCSCLFDHCNSDEQLDQLGLKDASLSNSGTGSRLHETLKLMRGTRVNHVLHATFAAASTVSILDGLPRRQTFDGGGLTTGGLSFTANHLIMLIFLFLFLTGSFSLLIMNTVCVHLCYQ
jgi:hypothetical protein